MNAHHVLPDATETRPAMVKLLRSRSTLVALHLIVSGLLLALAGQDATRQRGRPGLGTAR